ncbi:hypothetical protein A4A49_59959 [Nicotiana attenuata]|uniref:GRF-type domain-containing protein n=1 Tax=Nicotiana attenuata TaxID=49451 RepID=A0A1J6I4N0_NICAT|nr:hypothetical protein A4A49_59959 [Nicotiana attenuata]
MSVGSSDSINSKKKCRCGFVAHHFTVTTPMNYGRRFYKCPLPKKQGRGYWEWDDVEFPPQAVIVISSQRRKLEAFEIERNRLMKKIADFEASAVIDVETITKLRERLDALEASVVEDNSKIVELRGKVFG